ncbi:hypothetical protein TRAPUB_5344 [Trametes pubescens]|uniref:Uncharacterized protein n=1 Tax=Trametes pubescens TaxID=154538 RepID=A0A1M2V919_TRAPU|nr:hypothetical protein TRAPUB_5344 [Trametes pubescens]
MLDGSRYEFPRDLPHRKRSVLTIAYSAQSLKRKRSDEEVLDPWASLEPMPSAPLDLPIIFPSVKSNTDKPNASPPSPALTEIVDDVNEDGVVCMERAKASGVKVRDFAHEPLPKGPDPRAPEMWIEPGPLETLIMHDRYIRASSEKAAQIRLSGKHLYRLRHLGWVTKREEDQYWHEEDRKAMAEYEGRPSGPYPYCFKKGAKKPTAAYRTALRLNLLNYQPELEEDPSKVIDMSDLDNLDDMDDGLSRVSPEDLSAAAEKLRKFEEDPATAADNTTAHVDKKRRLSEPSPTASAAATPQGTPPAIPALALTPVPAPAPVRTSSRTASASRSSAPPASPRRLRPGRARGGLGRTQTFGTIA